MYTYHKPIFCSRNGYSGFLGFVWGVFGRDFKKSVWEKPVHFSRPGKVQIVFKKSRRARNT